MEDLGALGFDFVSPDVAKGRVHKHYHMVLHPPRRLTGHDRSMARQQAVVCLVTKFKFE
jgi:hypothetical protein